MSFPQVLGGIGQLMGAFQDAPQINPYAGAHYLTPEDDPSGQIKSPVWVGQDGHPITDPAFTSLPMEHQQMLSKTLYPNLHWYNKLTPQGQADMQANSAFQQGDPLAAQQLQEQLRANTGVYNNALQNRIGGAHTIGALAPQSRALLAGTDASGGFNEGEYGTGLQTEANTANDVYNRQAQRTGAELNPDANQYIAPTIANAAHLGMLQGQGALGRNDANQRVLNYRANYNDPMDAMRQLYESSHIAGPGINQLTIGQGGEEVLGKNPLVSYQNQLMANALGGIGGTGPSVQYPYSGYAPIGGGGNVAGQGSGTQPITAPTLQGNYGNLPPPANAPQGINPNIIGQLPSMGSSPTNSIIPPIVHQQADMGGWRAMHGDSIPQSIIGAPAIQGPQEADKQEITSANAYDDILPPQALHRLPIVDNTGGGGNGYQHIAQMKLRDAAVQQQKLLKSIAKQYGTGSPHYREAYADYVNLVNTLPQ